MYYRELLPPLIKACNVRNEATILFFDSDDDFCSVKTIPATLAIRSKIKGPLEFTDGLAFFKLHDRIGFYILFILSCANYLSLEDVSVKRWVSYRVQVDLLFPGTYVNIAYG